ncbi:hypothetical protein A2Z23_02355 [Candidatus Curtissbacteria bacterium RBG_16_39_7]|uniref:NodB homology domain-containing protein n=1 Tax=Candidatus Curtissbacteria bacterium RBG_16_39_7 TaxID=1797707 RepID=A0A1F5G4I6_9BACT|nr:MAG: hypothetical protein A2Z23_02355 [Candidatus Curtissbacteria bacterium RBG_16_39_7]
MSKEISRRRFLELAALGFSAAACSNVVGQETSPTPTGITTSAPKEFKSFVPGIVKGNPIKTPEPTPTPSARPEWPIEVLKQPVCKGTPDGPYVSLTFDDGLGYPSEIIDILNSKDVKITMFWSGRSMLAHADVVKKAVESGHEIANHTMNHYLLTLLSAAQFENMTDQEIIDFLYREEIIEEDILAAADPATITSEITECENTFFSICGQTTKPYFRPPGGRFNETVNETAANLGYRSFFWSIDPQDWKAGIDSNWLASYVVEKAQVGSIILLHFGRYSTVQALPNILDGLKNKGLEVVSLTKMAIFPQYPWSG